MADVVVESPKPIRLVVTESDFEPVVRSAITADRDGIRVLGGDSDDSEGISKAERLVLDALPGAIARRVGAMLPKGFEISELEFCFKLDCKVWGTGVGGEVKAKLRPSGKEADG
jgi:hypothetical protein